MKFWILFLTATVSLLLSSCGGNGDVEFGYQPPFIPVRVSINQRGKVELSSEYKFNTPIGTFDLKAGYSIDAIRRDANYPVLIIRVDDTAIVYELEPDNTFDVTFSGNDQLYRKVSLQREANGDIILELESISVGDPSSPVNSGITSSSSDSSSTIERETDPDYSDWCSGAFATRLYVGADAKVVAEPRLVVRENAGEGSPTVYGHSLSNGRTVTILEGPICDGGMLWWKGESGVITLTNGERHNIVGWMAEESGDEWLLEPLPEI